MLVFGDKIDLQQGIGAVIVFLGIILDMTSKKSNQKSSKVEPVLELEDFSPKDESRGLLEDYDRMDDLKEDYDHEIFNINHKKCKGGLNFIPIQPIMKKIKYVII